MNHFALLTVSGITAYTFKSPTISTERGAWRKFKALGASGKMEDYYIMRNNVVL